MIYNFCPHCGKKYGKEIKDAFLRKKDSLTCSRCRFVFYNNPKPTTNALITNSRGLLLVKRAVEPFAGYWDMPGGFIEYGEKPEEALFRELREELGVHGDVQELVGTYHDFYDNHGRTEERYSVIAFVYTVLIDENAFLTPQDDVEGYRYFSPTQLPDNIAFPGQKAFLRNYCAATSPQ